MSGIYSQLADLISANTPTALATVVSGDSAGAKLLVTGEGATEGSIHPALDVPIAHDARELLSAEHNEIREYEVAGHKVEVFIEVFPPPQRMVIVGAVHIAIPLHRMAKLLGYHVTVVDPRAAFANAGRFPQADEIVAEWPDEALAGLRLDTGTSVVVLTHDPKLDIPALLVATRSSARYVGAIGSRTTIKERRELLRAGGATDDEIGRISAPIGLDIGARTPAEIALAILAEVTAARHGREGGRLKR